MEGNPPCEAKAGLSCRERVASVSMEGKREQLSDITSLLNML
jgi:hypothetical protein